MFSLHNASVTRSVDIPGNFKSWNAATAGNKQIEI